ncbi:recombinase RAD52 LALA0_S09e00540g [Lachancea lanzarotensis]|uniref:DNA repair and recombination protein RAD52 n=1 Tax=Lachancea lanzarotensis TaxID=1245769 RepID=A0A0C7NBA1_9SACH|nr:uncharacterized protein LALA0_S09e00540g [Lachancea lanzarotensis]CEP63700.1 LALA0S09e00540g1_1 [Lachancea lanzarotensis]
MEVSKLGGSNSDDIQAKLDKKLGPEYISKRVGFGASRVAYIEGWKAINLANQIFGYNGWSTEVKTITIDFMDERQGKFCIGCTAIVRVTLTDGTFREDIGYGTVENERRKSSAFERAKKSAVTDALKRSLRAFGNALGNCLYDKSFLAKIDTVKFDPPDFDEGNLYRAADEANELARNHTVEHEGVGPPSKKRNVADTRPNSSNAGLAWKPEVKLPQQQQQQQLPDQPAQADQDPDELLDDSFMFSDEIQDDEVAAPANNSNNTTVSGTNSGPSNSSHARTLSGGNTAPVAFVTAKAAPNVQNQVTVPAGGMFDPKFRAQSIKHTVDQTTSSHIKTAVLKDKGIPYHRSDIYNRFAPKGKVLSDGDATITKNSTATNDVKSIQNNHSVQTAPSTGDQTSNANNRQYPSANSVRQLPPILTTPLPPQPQHPNIQPVGKPKFPPPNTTN